MEQSVYQYLYNRPDLVNFVRQHPIWYRYLTRDPNVLAEMEKEAKVFYGKTLPQKLERIGNNVQMLQMLIQFAGAMKD
ncbi:YlbE-like family protein [Oceanobacillus senegalensis]|uniref:YlbE-like family protein n=1 Tax=Oceanobacillus senegalensis TaxID=1936063 RepID=UPI000A311C44|nr:YlbE-like family protein [Oceanobacillus senegalensis]